jgi:CMP-N-acetylneuraminic acid synthetase
MIAAILFGRKGSVGFPGKNLYPVLSRPLCIYPLLAAVNSKKIDKIFVSTDDEEIMKIGKEYGAELIDRPAYLANATVLVDEVFALALKYKTNKSSYSRTIQIGYCLLTSTNCNFQRTYCL